MKTRPRYTETRVVNPVDLNKWPAVALRVLQMARALKRLPDPALR